jgi:hypothetical protein
MLSVLCIQISVTVYDPTEAGPAEAAHISCREILLELRLIHAQYWSGSEWIELSQKEDFRAAGG